MDNNVYNISLLQTKYLDFLQKFGKFINKYEINNSQIKKPMLNKIKEYSRLNGLQTEIVFSEDESDGNNSEDESDELFNNKSDNSENELDELVSKKSDELTNSEPIINNKSDELIDNELIINNKSDELVNSEPIINNKSDELILYELL